MKYTKQYATEADYVSDANNRVMPNLSLIREGNGTLKYNASYVDGRVATAGTIACVETSSPSNKVFVPYESWNTTQYTGLTPIGVVVVPATHTNDGTVRIMSLKNMDIRYPDSGSTATGGGSGSTSMFWGGYNSDVPGISNKTTVPTVDPANQEYGTVGSSDWARIPSNYVKCPNFSTGTASTLDVGARYYTGTESGRFGVSPYDKYGFKSYKVFNIYDSGSTNAMADMDGAYNTSKILEVDNAASTDWQAASTISNTSDGTANHAPAQCCWRYTTPGVEAHNWYLPSCGELAYLIVRYADINEALTKLMLADNTMAVRLWRYDDKYQDGSDATYGLWLWTSTEYSSIYARSVTVNDGNVDNYSKATTSDNNRVRAFAALAV